MTQVLLILVIALAITLAITLVKLHRPKYDGTIEVIDTPDKKAFGIEWNAIPDDWSKRKKVIFDVHLNAPEETRG